MSDAERNLDIKIRTTSDEGVRSGIQKAAEGAKNLTIEQGRLDKLTRRMAGPGGSLKGLQGALRGLTAEFPLLGRAAQLMVNPVALAVAAAVAVFQKFKREIEAVLKALDPTEWAAATNAIEEQRKALEASAEAAAKFNREIDTLKKGERDLADASNEEIGRLREQFAAQRQVLEARKAADLAAIGAAESRGMLAPDQAARMRAGIEGGFAAAGTQLSDQEATAVLRVRERERFGQRVQFNRATAAAAALAPQAAAAAENARRRKEAADLNSQRILIQKADIAKLQAQIDITPPSNRRLLMVRNLQQQQEILGGLQGQQSSLDRSALGAGIGAEAMGEQLGAARQRMRAAIGGEQGATRSMVNEDFSYRTQRGADAAAGQISARSSELLVGSNEKLASAVERLISRVEQIESRTRNHPE